VEYVWFALVLAVAVGAVVVSFYLKAKRREAFRAFALEHGLEYSPEDPFGLLEWPFGLFQRGEGRGIENVLWGRWEGQPMQAFDYWYFTESTDSKGRRHRSYRHFSCALIEVGAAFPHLEMAREGLFSRLADHLGLEDIEFESPEFNRRYNVKAQNQRFAYELLDGRMLEWLVNFDQGLSFEVAGNRILAYRSRVKPSGLVPLIGTAMMFRDRIPRVAMNLYPL
jgi:Protein of unknown function (DUF3137)